MAIQRTLTILKPDAVSAGRAGDIIKLFEVNCFRIVAASLVRLTRAEAEGFYAIHRAKPFFASLTEFMSSGPALVMVLERENAVSELRRIMGSTDPSKADPGTIRKLYAESIERNAIHGSDSPETAAHEISFFFPGIELLKN